MNRSCISTQECSSFSLSIQIAHFFTQRMKSCISTPVYVCWMHVHSNQILKTVQLWHENLLCWSVWHLHCCYVNAPNDLFSSLENLYAPLLCLFFIFYFFMYCWGNSALCYSSVILLENVWIHCQLGVTIPLLLGCFPTYTISTDWTVPDSVTSHLLSQFINAFPGRITEERTQCRVLRKAAPIIFWIINVD